MATIVRDRSAPHVWRALVVGCTGAAILIGIKLAFNDTARTNWPDVLFGGVPIAVAFSFPFVCMALLKYDRPEAWITVGSLELAMCAWLAGDLILRPGDMDFGWAFALLLSPGWLLFAGWAVEKAVRLRMESV